MDVSCFSPSPNVHNLYFFFAPLTPFSPSSHLSSLSKFCPVRREVLLHRRRSSAAHPGLRSPGKSRTVGLGYRRAHRSLLVVGASTCSQPLSVVIVAVAVVTFTLVSLPYLISWGWKSKNDFKHVRHLSSLLVLHPFKDIMDQVVEGWALVSGQFMKETSKEKACHSVENFTEISDASKNLKASVQSHKFDSSRHGALIKEASDSPSSVVFCNKSFPTDSEVAIPSVLHSMFVTPPLHRVAQLSGFQTEAHQQNTECNLTIYETKGNTEPFRVNESHKQLDEIEYLDNACHEEDKFMNSRSLFKDSSREGIYRFYEEDQSVKVSSATLNGPENFPCGPSLLGSNNVTSMIGDMNRHGSDLSSKDFYHNADNLNGRVPLASLKRDPLGKRKLRRNRGFANDSVKSSMHQNSHHDLAQLPSINGMKFNGKQTIPEEYSTYRSLLHVGRINDSLELLEAMERVGLLDMNKVYHAKFFEKCKTKKAVKAAFRFTKLIPNPTLSAFNMLMSVCAISQDFEGAFQVLQLVREAGLKADCKLYTTLISTCAKSGKVDAMFEVFHEMVNTKVEPNLHTYGALIDGCARAGQVAKAFGAYGIMRSKNVKPDRVVFNALITACGRSGALDRAFDVLTEMLSETQPIDPDHITVGALIKACMHAGQVDRAREVYKMIHEYQIKGTPEVYTIAVSSCSQSGDWEYACNIYNDMTTQGVVPDEMFLSALMGVAGHAGKLDAAFGVLHEAIAKGLKVGPIAYSSLMGACSNAKSWENALELYEDIKSMNLNLTVSTMNALITALCDGDQLQKALEVLSEMKAVGLRPNSITYSILLSAIEKTNDLEVGLMLVSQAKKDGVAPNLVMCRCLIAICLRRLNNACTLGDSVLSLNSGSPYMDNKWTAMALLVYRETILAGVVPTGEVFSQLLGCLQFPRDSHLKERLSENLSIHSNTSKYFNPCTLVDGFGEYDPRASTLFEEAASLGIVPSVSFIESPIVIDAQSLLIQTTEVYILTVFKSLKHRLAAGAKLPNLTILLPTEKTHIHNLEGVKTLNIAGRISQTVGSLLRRLGIPFQGSESYGKIRISSLSMTRWFQPRHDSPLGGKLTEFIPSQSKLGKGISYQQRDIRTGNLSLD